ncbi:response regulator transcription factor [Tropicimonas isoalkanivorans]|uniref:Response regulator receiver domain-containing protein n=1 Tax=Tropicimonas isoalkanivorans TaxID=441112 RepID=A0A1I1NK75_9RHOB|nr:response regulator [Tropicimonas isoalkanivorans]SFC98061.1 Response regulator receiver domain-containing protein [Tropicimonas isoalkanivorans]
MATDHPARVLIVEDEDNIALALGHVLKREGFEVSRVVDGETGLQAIRDERPDLVLLDVMLPGMSGYEVCQNVRLEPELSGVKILIMTARGKAMERRKGLALGADGFIAKPFDLSELLQRTRALLKGEAESSDA